MPHRDPRQPTPLSVRNLPIWAWRTARADRRRYRSQPRPLSLARMGRTLAPHLDNAVFVVGADRSGTTFLGNSLSTLRGVSYHHEPIATKAAARYVYDGAWGYRRAALFYRSVYAWLMRIHADGDLRFAEKTPSNSFVIPFLARAFPDALFIHIVRDGRDATASHLRQPWLLSSSSAMNRREPGGYRYGPDSRFWVERERRVEFESTTDAHRCIWSWRRHTEAALVDGRRLATRYLEVRYEDLVGNPLEQARVILEFLQVRDQASARAFSAALSEAQAGSIGRWRRELDDAALATIEAEAGSLMRLLGYDP